MKLILSILVALAIAITATAQDIDQIGGVQQGTATTGSGGDVDQLGAGSSNELPELKPPTTTTTYVAPLWETREGIEAHVRASQCTLSHSVATCSCKQSSYRPVRRTTTARKEGTKAMPQQPINVTVNVPQQKSVGLPNDPDFGGLIQADPNLAIKTGTSMTYSRSADGALYYNTDPGGGSLLWLWILLGVLGAAALIALLARVLGGGNGGGNNHYYNYPQQPQPAPQPVQQPQPQANPGGAAPAAPFTQPGPAAPGGGHGNGGANQRPGWQDQSVVVMQMVPTGSPAQHQTPPAQPVVIHNHFNVPPTPQPNPNQGGGRGKKTQTPTEPAEEKK